LVYGSLTLRVEHIDGAISQGRVLLNVGAVIGRGGVNQRVTLLHECLVLRAHEDEQLIHLRGADGLRNCRGDAPLLDTDIDDPGHVIRQGQVRHGLREKQCDGKQDQEDVGFEEFRQTHHFAFFLLVSFFFNVYCPFINKIFSVMQGGDTSCNLSSPGEPG
jgi:hypothetical protein